MKFNLTLCCSLLLLQSFAQTTNNQTKITELLENYFHFDRENIHVQFNKSIYVNNEDIAFKGYISNKTTHLPEINTTNVQLVIYNEQQQIIQKQLLYAYNGNFEGGIHLNDKFPTGKYFFHFYTNWMNNFIEDESFIQSIEIINKNEPYHLKSKQPNWETAKIALFPESGIIINETSNKVGVQITDCNKKGIEIKDGTVINSKSEIIARFSTNAMGNGFFFFIPVVNEKYTVKIKSDKINLSQPIPNTQYSGITISYNNNLANNVLAVIIKTNETGVKLYQNKKFNLVIHQNKNLIQKEFAFENNQPEQIIRFSKLNLSNGVNTIRVIDEDLNEISQRLIYINTSSKPITSLEAKSIKKDSISLSGSSNIKDANLSISVLPKDNINTAQNTSIIGTFYLNSYLAQPEKETYSYFDPENKNQKQDTELLMLNQLQNKYKWNDIKLNPPKSLHPFLQGTTISGKVEKKINPNSKYKVSLISLKNKIFLETTVNENNDYKFENIFARDSTTFFLQLTNEKNIPVYSKMTVRIFKPNSKTISPRTWDTIICPLSQKEEVFTFSNSNKDVINLDDIIIKNTFKKTNLIHKEGNNFATAYKINEKEFGSILDFLGRNGYRTGYNPTDNSVFIKNRMSDIVRNTDGTPDVFIDDVIIYDLNLLNNYNIEEVDEIYIDKMGSSGFSTGGNGIIKIYLKAGTNKDFLKTKLTSFVLTNGFSKAIEYKNSKFENQKELDYFGILDWSPNIEIKDNSTFEIKFPKENQKEIKVLIEGFSNDGQLISEIRNLTIPSNP
ncbi:hypothetical protein EOD40_12655 [Flavobacterium sufflavum]|uniref:TonB-dependent receptor plug domain-containing protein n=1 Tax=Flavobacterium sufflavum TaxID=1921138 RepID=A0A437KR55_9FLAO|nr:hypothetical protein [Flavobacterium sufflavum]RVT74366.1 hypothetical protein EOD40_12655 [Flavobacterium sufflavum]